MTSRYKFTVEFRLGDKLIHKEFGPDRIQDFGELKAVIEAFNLKYPGAQIESCKLEDRGGVLKSK